MAVSVAHALCVYAEPLVERRRVVVVGDSSLGLDARLVAMGARMVHVYDPDAARARESAPSAPRGVIVRELPPGEIDVREGAFDLAIVPDLAAIADRAGLLVRLRKLVGESGAALVAASSAPPGDASGLDYYEMYDLVALQFASVRMIAQVAFRGVTLAELGEQDEEPAVSVDTQLAGEAEAPEVFVALASQRDVRLEPYAIVQLPRDEDEAPRAPAPSEHAELAGAVLRANLLQTQLDEQKTQLAQLRAQAGQADRVDELEALLQERATKLKDAETRAGEHYVRAERVGHEVRRLEEEVARQRDKLGRIAKELDDERRLRARADADLGTAKRGGQELAQARERVALLEDGLRAAEEATAVLTARVVEAEQTILQREAQLQAVAARAQHAEARAAILEVQVAESSDGHGEELAQLEVILRQRGAAIAALEHELMRREAIVRELVATLEEAEPHATEHPPTTHAVAAVASEVLDELQSHLRAAVEENAQLRSKLDALALEVARREGELQARTWRIAELEERVASFEARPAVAPPAPQAPPASTKEDALRAELSALRQALAQEHEARVRAESGEELTRARADLARQAALLEQLARELEARSRGEAPGQAGPPAQT